MECRIYIRIIMMVLMIVASAVSVHSSDTLLMFVGEDLEMLSIASRKEEAAWSAPAVARVITHKDIRDSGDRTISEVIDGAAGFYVEKNRQGSIPYLRGISNSALVLFDTVPMGSGVDKSNHLIDEETSLTSIKRIEIIRGAGSVLWGPDAFAGVVNAVPFTGKDFAGTETGLALSSGDQDKQAWIRSGKDHGDWASFFSVSVRKTAEDDTALNVKSFWNDGVTPSPVSRRFGSGTLDDSHYLELYGNISISDWLVLSAKFSDSQKAFSVTDWEQDYIWEEGKSYQTRFFKMEARKDLGVDASLRFIGTYSEIGLEKTVIDQKFDQKEYSAFGELIYERALFSSAGLLTVGTSFKEDHFEDILVWNSFFPGYLVPENLYFLPETLQEDYDNTLFSVFSQYRHKIKNIEFWAGFRSDNHDKFEDKISFSSGAAWSLSPEVIAKFSYGTGYRTPFAKQIIENGTVRLEKIKNINFQLQYKPGTRNLFGLTLFRNDIDNHVVGDRYEGAGVSLSNSQMIEGIELEWECEATDTLSFSGSAVFLHNNGPDEVFLFNDYTYFDENGNEQKHYQRLTHRYDTGPDMMLDFQGIWQVTEKIKLIPRVRYFSERELYYSVGNETRKYPSAWLSDLRLRIRTGNSSDLDLYVNNIFGTRFKTFDSASAHPDESTTVGVVFKYRW